MPKKFIQRHLPNPERLRASKGLRIFGKLLEDPYLLHLNRRSVAGGVALGLFMAFVPLPGQLILGSALAIYLRVNILITLSFIWITNPLTIPPMFLFCYEVGNWMLGGDGPHLNEVVLSWEWISSRLSDIWRPLVLGSLSVGSLSALIGYLTIQILWRMHIVRHLKARKLRKSPFKRPTLRGLRRHPPATTPDPSDQQDHDHGSP